MFVVSAVIALICAGWISGDLNSFFNQDIGPIVAVTVGTPIILFICVAALWILNKEIVLAYDPAAFDEEEPEKA
jgi:hypothetical protein